MVSVLAEGLPLVDVARRTQIPWDELVREIAHLERSGAIGQTDGRSLSSARKRLGRLSPGDPAPAFVLPDMDGNRVSLSAYRGRKVLLRFSRFAGCPMCNARNQQFVEAWDEFQRVGVQVVNVFGSPSAALHKRVGRAAPPVPTACGSRGFCVRPLRCRPQPVGNPRP